MQYYHTYSYTCMDRWTRAPAVLKAKVSSGGRKAVGLNQDDNNFIVVLKKCPLGPF